MSKQQKAKDEQGYSAKPIFPMCSNCVFYQSEIKTTIAYGHTWDEEKNIRCGIGGFSVKKQGNCNRHQFKS